MDLKALDQETINKMKSACNIYDVYHCINELVLNSLDAESTSIAVRVNLQDFEIQVVDNGRGISFEGLKLVGQRYVTTKCQTSQDLKQYPKWYGFRGEALASIAKSSTRVTISSRERDNEQTYTKIIEKDKHGKVEEDKKRFTPGTTVTVEGFLSCFPVRQQCIKPSELDNVRRNLESLIIIQPQISFSFRDNVTGKLLINRPKTDNIAMALKSIYSEIDGNKFILIKVRKHKVEVKGLIYKEYLKNKRLQYVYVNKRPIHCPKIWGIITQTFLKLKGIKRNDHPLFVIQIKCPNSDIDFRKNDCKTEVDFKYFNLVAKCLQKMIESNNSETERSSEKPSEQHQKVGGLQFRMDCGISQIGGAIKGVATKRKANETLQSLSFKKKKTGSNDNGHLFGTHSTKNVLKSIDNIEQCKRMNLDDTDNEISGKKLLMDWFLKSVEAFPNTNYQKNPQLFESTDLPCSSNYITVRKKANIKKPVAVQTVLERKQVPFFVSNSQEENQKRPQTITTLENTDLSPILPDYTSQDHFWSPTLPESKDSLEYMGTSASLMGTINTPKNLSQHFLNSQPTTIKKKEFVFRPFSSSSRINITDPFNQTKRLWETFTNNTNQGFDKKSINKSNRNINLNSLNDSGKIFNFSSENLKPTKTYNSSQQKQSNSQSFTMKFQKYRPLVDENDPFDFGIPSALEDTVPLRQDHDIQTPFKPSIHLFAEFNFEHNPRPNDNVEQKDYFQDYLNSFQENHEASIFQIQQPSNDFFRLNETFHSDVSNEEKNLQFFRLETAQEATITNETKINLKENKSFLNKIEKKDEKEPKLQESCPHEQKTEETEKIAEKVIFENSFYPNDQKDDSSPFNPKDENQLFSLRSRHNFMPKGLSQVCRKFKDVEESLNQSSRENLQNAILKQYEDELALVKWEKYLKNRNFPQILEELYKSKAKEFKSEIANINKNSFPKYISKDFENFKFDKEIFENLEIVGQVDCKFIAGFNRKFNLLLMFDQHAVDERVRLETLIKHYNTASFKLKTPLTFFLPNEDLNLLKNQKENLEKLGLEYEMLSNGITIKQIPLCIYNKILKGANTNQILKGLIEEMIDTLRNNNGLIVSIPEIIKNIINSEACQGAIKFGDKLERNECLKHIQDLSKCSLPFQCAHGRPTIIPIVKLNEYFQLNVANSVNLKKLKNKN